MRSASLRSPLLIIAACSLLPLAIMAGDKPVTAPAPAPALRELTTDRPDKTEGAITVDAGHLQIETDLANWSHDKSDGVTTDGIDFGATNFRLGVTNWMDFEVVVQTYHYERTRENGHTSVDDGFGDLTLRTTVNFWGNDGDTKTAFGIVPFVTLPTARGDFGVSRTEGGIILPFGITLSENWGLGVMTELDVVNDDSGDYTTHWINSASLSCSITDKLGMYGEFFSEVPMENSSAWEGTLDVGFTYLITANLQVDAGVNFGVTDAADDINPFAGISVRF